MKSLVVHLPRGVRDDERLRHGMRARRQHPAREHDPRIAKAAPRERAAAQLPSRQATSQDRAAEAIAFYGMRRDLTEDVVEAADLLALTLYRGGP